MRQGFQVVADARARAPRAHKGKPGGVGGGLRVGDDFDDVAIFEHGAQRGGVAVDGGARGAVANAAVDGVGEINHRGALRQGDDFAVGGEDVNGVRGEVHLHVVPELGGIARFVLDVEQRLQPVRAGFARVGLGAAAVEPVGGHAAFGNLVHLLGAYLEFDADVGRADQRGVQGLVAVGFGVGDEVVELTRHGLVELVQVAQRGVAGGAAGHDDAHAVEVAHLCK